MKSGTHEPSSILAHQQHQEETFSHVLLKTIKEVEFKISTTMKTASYSVTEVGALSGWPWSAPAAAAAAV